MAIKVFQDFYPASSADMIVVSGFFTAVANIYEIVYAIGEDTLWGQGYGEAAIDKALRIAFSKLGAHSVIAKINPANERSRRLAAACGFRNVGTSGFHAALPCREPQGTLYGRIHVKALHNWEYTNPVRIPIVQCCFISGFRRNDPLRAE